MLKKFMAVTALLAIMSSTNTVLAFQTEAQLTVDEGQAQQWNRFVNGLLVLHQQQIRGRSLKKTERIGGYYRLPKFYREVEYVDVDSGQLLGRIQRERVNPENIHAIEVFLYDENGRVVQDFAASYLPRYRNAPIQTLINLHHYNGELHSFRQFDASGIRIYEDCRGTFSGKKVELMLEEYEIDEVKSGAQGGEAALVYQACFAGTPESTGIFIDPFRVATSFRRQSFDATWLPYGGEKIEDTR